MLSIRRILHPLLARGAPDACVNASQLKVTFSAQSQCKARGNQLTTCKSRVGFTVSIAASSLIGLTGLAWWSLQPRVDPLELADGLISLSESRGQSLLEHADAKTDYVLLSENFESQELRSFCGVASGVTV